MVLISGSNGEAPGSIEPSPDNDIKAVAANSTNESPAKEGTDLIFSPFTDEKGPVLAEIFATPAQHVSCGKFMLELEAKSLRKKGMRVKDYEKERAESPLRPHTFVENPLTESVLLNTQSPQDSAPATSHKRLVVSDILVIDETVASPVVHDEDIVIVADAEDVTEESQAVMVSEEGSNGEHKEVTVLDDGEEEVADLKTDRCIELAADQNAEATIIAVTPDTQADGVAINASVETNTETENMCAAVEKDGGSEVENAIVCAVGTIST
jgi:hypothetical protein